MADCLARLKASVKALKRETMALYYASRDPGVGWFPKFLIAMALAYVLSPIDLIPDFIPVLGILDDLIIVPMLIMLALRFIPPDKMSAARQRADAEPLRLSKNIGTAVVMLLIWLACFEGSAYLVVEHWKYARAHTLPTYAVATALFVAFAIAAVLTESDDAMAAMRRYCCCCQQGAPLAEPLLPTDPPAV